MAQSALLDDLDILRAILKGLAVGVAVSDRHGKLICFNTEAERILGKRLENLDASEWASVYGCYLPDMVTPYPPEQLPLARAVRGQESLYELIFIRHAGQPRGVWISVSGRPFYDASGEIAGGVVTFRDVTEAQEALRKTAAESTGEPPNGAECGALAETLDRFRAHYDRLCRALEQTADSVIITDRRGVIEYVNRAFEQTTGFAAGEVLGQTPRVLKSGAHDAQFYRRLWDRLLDGRPFRGTVVNRKKSGELYWAEQTISPMKDDRGEITHFVSVLKDMTDLREKQRQEFYLDLAREIQQRFYNPAISIPGLDIAGVAYPADQTGGDYFDFIAHPDGGVSLVIGDVSGHGFGSALVMAETRAYLRSYARLEPDMGVLLDHVNRALVADLGGGQHVTLLAARIDPCTRSLRYAGAGHVRCYLLRRSGEVGLVLESKGPPLGIFPDAEFPASRTFELSPGDRLLLMTDGVLEWVNGEGSEFGETGALDYVRRHPDQTASDLARGLYEAARTFAGPQPQQDDFSVVICKIP